MQQNFVHRCIEFIRILNGYQHRYGCMERSYNVLGSFGREYTTPFVNVSNKSHFVSYIDGSFIFMMFVYFCVCR